MSRKNKFSLGTIALIFALTSLMTWVSFFFYVMKDAGQINNDELTLNLLADSYLFFRLPLQGIFWAMVEDNTFLFYLTLFLNPIFWSLIMERLIYWVKKKR